MLISEIGITKTKLTSSSSISDDSEHRESPSAITDAISDRIGKEAQDENEDQGAGCCRWAVHVISQSAGAARASRLELSIVIIAVDVLQIDT